MFETDIIGLNKSKVIRKKGKSAEESTRSTYMLSEYKLKRIPDHIGGRDFDAKKRNFYEI